MLVGHIVEFMCAIFTCISPEYKDNSLDPGSNEIESDSEIIQFVPKTNISASNSGDLDNDTAVTSSTSTNLIVKKWQEVENPVVWTRSGGVRGFTMKSITGKPFSAFRGIPFAKPPVGDLRFRAPVKNTPWEGIRDAIEESPTCLQVDFIQLYKVTGTEDCLYLNIYTPKLLKKIQNENNKPLSVMVFIHGGGFFFGSSNLYGPAYIMEEDVVLVSLNYRLGSLGFLATGDLVAPGNNGLKDQTFALKWVKANIHLFGGDPNSVTIFGESAGAGSVQFHMLSPMSRGLFHRGISESGCTFCFWSISEKAVDIGKKYASLLNCSTENSREMVNCLRNLDGVKLVMGQLQFLEWTMYPVVVFGPVIEPMHKHAFLVDLPQNIYRRGKAARVPWITGFNSDEGALNIATLLVNQIAQSQINQEWDKYGPVFLELNNATKHPKRIARNVRDYYLGQQNITFDTRQGAIKMFSDRYIIACGVKSILYHAQYSGRPVYAYYFNYRGKYSLVQLLGQNPAEWGVSHLDDLIYLMNNTIYYPTLQVSDEEYQVSRLIINLWTNFAKTGEPKQTTSNGNFLKVWKPVKTGKDELEYLELNLNPKMVPDPFSQRVEFWNNLRLDEDIM